jgi:hypothetical protein
MKATSKDFWCGLLIVVLWSACMVHAVEPPQLPPLPLKLQLRGQPYRIGFANNEYAPKCDTNCPPPKPARTNAWIVWTPSTTTARECMYFEVHKRKTLTDSWVFASYVTNAAWLHQFTNGMEFVKVRAWDFDMKQPSVWW